MKIHYYFLRGVWELHRLSRETVLEWLSKRREADGIVSSTQKRRPERRRGGAASVFIEDGEFQSDGDGSRRAAEERRSGGPRGAPGGGRRDADGEIGDMAAGPGPGSSLRGGGVKEEDVLMSLMSDFVARPGGSGGARDQQQEAQVVGMSRAEMAALRSSLPSQKKYKGRVLAEKMGVKTGDT